MLDKTQKGLLYHDSCERVRHPYHFILFLIVVQLVIIAFLTICTDLLISCRSWASQVSLQ
jgi:hypothetical protein